MSINVVLKHNPNSFNKNHTSYSPVITKCEINSTAYENEIFITPTGFREYDARWLYPEQINLLGIRAIGAALGTQIIENGVTPKIIVGHDYRSYSQAIKQTFIAGLIDSGMQVIDIGLCLSPTAYFAQFHLDCPAVAMITASHNENGWTGIKMGFNRPLTLQPEDMTRLKEIALSGLQVQREGGTYARYATIITDYIADFIQKFKPFNRKIKAVVATGNGTAGLFAPAVLEALGVDVVHLHTDLDYNFPHYNPNPEDMTMLHDLAKNVTHHKADIGLAFDGDGDRCGIVDSTGREIFADKGGLMLARDWAAHFPNSQFVVDVKSTGLFIRDAILQAHNCKTDYHKTGHSYMKRRVNELGALAGFEKSGHYFIGGHLGRGYDDGILSAILMCQLLDNNINRTIADLYNDLPITYLSPTMSPYCDDTIKYDVINRITKIFQEKFTQKQQFLGRTMLDCNDINGVRVTLDDGSWVLVRASSNKPNLVVVVESVASHSDMVALFRETDKIVSGFSEVGDYDQKL
jgi:phosphomannomutase / phosphoglucomutase